MKLGEAEFIELIEGKVREQKKLVDSEVLPSWAGFLGSWFSVHPWRVIIPLSVIVYFVLRFFVGVVVVDFVLGLFGGFR